MKLQVDGSTNPIKSKYDFIIVGAGSTGSVLANRLSEVTTWEVLLLEIGTVPTQLTDIPMIAPIFQLTNYNWGYLMEKQSNFCLGLVDERMNWPQGKVLGGSSVINYMIHVRGNRHDYDRWANLSNHGWSYQDVLPYFLKSEDASIRDSDFVYRNVGGYLGVQDVPFRTESAQAFVRGAQEVGYQYVDYNGQNQLGVSYVQATMRRGLRCSAEKAFLRPAVTRPNLTILTKSRVTKILIDTNTKKAYGIEYIRNNQLYTVKASKEVILSAGAFNSPQLLMLSGIGPANHLQELNITLLQNLPVGQKLYDHLSFLGLLFKVNQSIMLKQSQLEDPRAFLNLILDGAGPLTNLGGVEALVYLKTNVTRYSESYPDVELMFLAGGLHTDRGNLYKQVYGVSDKVYNAIWKNLEDKYVVTVCPTLLHPKSYGYLRLKSSNPFHWPKLYGNYMTDPDGLDTKTFIAAIRETQKIMKSRSMRKYGAEIVTTPVPGCERHDFDSDNYWECALRHVSTTIHHQVGTCKMGPFDDAEAVVDSKLRVRGIKYLRVADISIMPTTVSAHTNVPAIMIGEKASDLIKKDWIKNQS
ncbi:hypothetical protein FQR65_LT05019 [Abscondita terminalis]|nr:hypothetical protein FQR65_LT05019 [Abscondita terminalis]